MSYNEAKQVSPYDDKHNGKKCLKSRLKGDVKMEAEKVEHGLKGKAGNRTLPEDQKASTWLQARCKPSDKAKWVKAAQANRMKLAQWVTEKLNEEAAKMKS